VSHTCPQRWSLHVPDPALVAPSHATPPSHPTFRTCLLPASRFSKARTAKRRYIQDVAIPNLKRGKLPPDEDLKMLKEFPHDLQGSSSASRVATEGGAPATRPLPKADELRFRDWIQKHSGPNGTAHQTTPLSLAAWMKRDLVLVGVAVRERTSMCLRLLLWCMWGCIILVNCASNWMGEFSNTKNKFGEGWTA